MWRSDGIGHGAHICGLLAGMGLAIVLLAFGAVPLAPGEKTLLHCLGWSLPTTPLPEQMIPGLPPLPPEEDKTFYNIPPLLENLDAPEFDLSSDKALPPPLPLRPKGVRSRFEAWRRTRGAVHLRCVCGKSLVYVPTKTAGSVQCPACGTWIDVPGR